MAVVIKAPSARLDLYEVWEYVALEREHQAARLIDTFEEKFSLLAENPFLGRSREELAPNLRSFPVGSYFISGERTGSPERSSLASKLGKRPMCSSS